MGYSQGISTQKRELGNSCKPDQMWAKGSLPEKNTTSKKATCRRELMMSVKMMMSENHPYNPPDLVLHPHTSYPSYVMGCVIPISYMLANSTTIKLLSVHQHDIFI
jgi:hypothetical protein